TESSSDPAASGQCYVHDHDKKKQPPTATVVDAGHSGVVQLLANSFTAISFCPPRRWFGSPFVGLFKDATSDGRLVINRVDQRGCTMAKTFKVKTHLATDTPNRREAYSNIVVFLFLLAGGFFSVLLNFALPSHIRKGNLRGQLAGLGARISNLSTRLASRVRVVAGLDLRLLDERLRRLTWTSSEFAAAAKMVEDAIPLLEKRIAVLEALGSAREKFEQLRLHCLPPTQILAMEETFEAIIEFTKKSVPDAQKAQDKINDLEKQLDAAGQKDDTFAAELQKRATGLQDEIAPKPAAKTTRPKPAAKTAHSEAAAKTAHSKPAPEPPTPEPTWAETAIGKVLQSELCEAVSIMKQAAEHPVLPEDYVKVDRALFQLEQARSYVQHVNCPHKDHHGDLALHQADLIALLKSDNGLALFLASRLVLQVREGKFGEHIVAAWKSHQLRITQDHFLITPFEPCVFKLEFLDPALDTATAREDWICQWEFKHPMESPLTEEGWEVTHYFQRADRYDFTVKLIPRSHDAQCDAEAEKHPAASPENKCFNVIDHKYWEKKQEKTESDHKKTETDHKKPHVMCIPVLAETPGRFSVVVWRTLFGPDKGKWEAFKEAQPAPLAGLRFIAAQWKRSKTGSNRGWQTLSFFLALLVVLIGMIAGAKEQILKLDLVPALIAIFLAGFGADQIKNLLTKQNESGSSPKSGGNGH
ncbi:MAG TPA: hypothetical protein VJ723_05720, partial [Candidatus Angelobacter sp.]|nr:hypothetical protein [Candidatus Angelobacter sp.]